MEREVGNCVGCELTEWGNCRRGGKAVRFRWEDWSVGPKREIGGGLQMDGPRRKDGAVR